MRKISTRNRTSRILPPLFWRGLALSVLFSVQFLLWVTLTYDRPAHAPELSIRHLEEQLWPSIGEKNIRTLSLVLQVSDIHISAHDQGDKSVDLARLLDRVLPELAPEYIVVTGDLTDAKTSDKVGSEQSEQEWRDYHDLREYISGRYRNTTIWFDLPGNHDVFNVPHVPIADEWPNEHPVITEGFGSSIDPVSDRHLTRSGWLLEGLNLVPEPGPRRPFNFVGHLTPVDAQSLVSAMAQNPTLPVAVFSHYPTSTVQPSQRAMDTLRSSMVGQAFCHESTTIPETLACAGVRLYLSGHLHTAMELLPRGMTRAHVVPEQRSGSTKTQGVLEIELGDWKDNRVFRILALTSDGRAAYADLRLHPADSLLKPPTHDTLPSLTERLQLATRTHPTVRNHAWCLCPSGEKAEQCWNGVLLPLPPSSTKRDIVEVIVLAWPSLPNLRVPLVIESMWAEFDTYAPFGRDRAILTLACTGAPHTEAEARSRGVYTAVLTGKSTENVWLCTGNHHELEYAGYVEDYVGINGAWPRPDRVCALLSVDNGKETQTVCQSTGPGGSDLAAGPTNGLAQFFLSPAVRPVLRALWSMSVVYGVWLPCAMLWLVMYGSPWARSIDSEVNIAINGDVPNQKHHSHSTNLWDDRINRFLPVLLVWISINAVTGPWMVAPFQFSGNHSGAVFPGGYLTVYDHSPGQHPVDRKAMLNTRGDWVGAVPFSEDLSFAWVPSFDTYLQGTLNTAFGYLPLFVLLFLQRSSSLEGGQPWVRFWHRRWRDLPWRSSAKWLRVALFMWLALTVVYQYGLVRIVSKNFGWHSLMLSPARNTIFVLTAVIVRDAVRDYDLSWAPWLNKFANGGQL
eukprot:Clim_evm20s15 gene=Clim_evmTU20s15